MKWPFLNRLRISRGSSHKLESEGHPITSNNIIISTTSGTTTGKTKKSDARKRYRRARLLDLLCTVRHRARLHQAPSCCSSHLSDKFSSQELPILRAGVPTGPSSNELCSSSLESLVELIRHHSLALRRPIPTLTKPSPGDLGPRRRRSMLQELVCRPLSTHHHAGEATAAVKNTQSALCPTCQNVMIFMPQKRKSCDEIAEHYDENRAFPKRLRPCLESYNLSYVPSTLGNSTPRYRDPLTVSGSKMESFNPTYLSTELDDQTIYSVIADDSSSSSASTSSLPHSDNQSTTCRVTERPKLVGTRRTARYSGTDRTTFDQWLLHRNHQSRSMVAEETVDNGPTYDVIDSEVLELEQTNPKTEVDLMARPPEEVHVFGAPCMSSTLKRGSARTGDQVTLYDEVASDTDDAVTAGPQFDSLQAKVKLRSRRRYYQQSPDSVHDPVKRVRREYFVCEE